MNGQPFPAGGRLTAGPDETRIALVPAWAPAVGGALGGTRLSADRALVHFRIDAAPRLGRVPRDAQVVVILDWSRSLDQSLCQAGVAGAAAFLRHFEGASVEVLTVDRQVHRRFGRLVPVGRALADLNAMPSSGATAAIWTPRWRRRTRCSPPRPAATPVASCCSPTCARARRWT